METLQDQRANSRKRSVFYSRQACANGAARASSMSIPSAAWGNTIAWPCRVWLAWPHDAPSWSSAAPSRSRRTGAASCGFCRRCDVGRGRISPRGDRCRNLEERIVADRFQSAWIPGVPGLTRSSVRHRSFAAGRSAVPRAGAARVARARAAPRPRAVHAPPPRAVRAGARAAPVLVVIVSMSV